MSWASDAGTQNDQVITYICSIAYMYVLSVQYCLRFVDNRYQVLAANTRPGIWSKRSTTVTCASGVHGVCVLFRLSERRVPYHGHSFFGLSGMYFSLQYLSLSDAMVLSFLSPILTGFTGAIFLKEPLALKELFAGCKHLST